MHKSMHNSQEGKTATIIIFMPKKVNNFRKHLKKHYLLGSEDLVKEFN